MFNRLRAWIRDYFGFSRSETNGFIILMGLIVFFFSAPFIFRYLQPQIPLDVTADRLALDSLIAELEANQSIREEESSYLPLDYEKFNGKPEKVVAELSPFDPNTASEEDLQGLGLPDWLARRIVKYRQNGGVFRVKSDLAKIYGMRQEDYQRLETFIQLPAELQASSSTYPMDSLAPEKQFAIDKTNFDLNMADTSQLKAIRGIGSKLSARIVSYRERLGGFVSADQLLEVYYLSPEAAATLKENSYISKSFIPRKISINSATIEELAQHPYLKKHQAVAIVNYREQHGTFKNIEDLIKVRALPIGLPAKLAPYIAFE